MVQLSTWQL